MDERLRFVARLLEGEKMSRVCREFGISRPTGYKIFNRYKDLGYQGLLDRSRRPYRHANRLLFQVERAIIRLRNQHPTWGAPRIREKLIRSFPMVPPPAKHGACSAGSPWTGPTAQTQAPQGPGHASERCEHA